MTAHLLKKSFLKTTDKTEQSMFLTDITEKEVFDIINNAANKYRETVMNSITTASRIFQCAEPTSIKMV